MSKARLTTEYIKGLEPKKTPYRVWDEEQPSFCVLVSSSGTKSFVIVYRINNKQRTYTVGKFGKVTPTIARKEAARLLGLVAGGSDIMAVKQTAKAKAKRDRRATLGVFIDEEYQPYIETHLKGHKETLRVLRRDFAHLMTARMEDISVWKMKRWCADQLKAGLHPNTINRRMANLKTVLTLAAESGVIEQSPLAGMAQLKSDNNQKVRFLSEDEEKSLRNALEARQETQRIDRVSHNEWREVRHLEALELLAGKFTDYLMPMVLAAINTGMRRGELFSLEWPQVDFKGRLITVAGARAKSGNTRYIPMNDEVFNTLITWRNETNSKTLVFPSPVTGKRLNNICTSWATLLKSANIEAFRFHDMRHHFASQLVMKGVDLLTVKELLGHSNLDMTLRYAHLAPEHKAAAVALLNQN